MSRITQIVFGFAIAGFMVAGPLWYANYRSKCFRNFRVVQDGVLYRSGQVNLAGLKRLVHDHGIKTVISLRDGEKPNDIAEQEYLAKHGDTAFYRLPPKAWVLIDGKAPAEENLAQFREIMSNTANHPVLIHCYKGVHRTGAFCAVYRMDYHGWSNDQAILEMRNLGYTILDEHQDLMSFLENYRPRRPAPTPFRTVSHEKLASPEAPAP